MQIMQIFLITCAVEDVVSQNDEQDSNTYEPGHDGRCILKLHSQRSLQIILEGKRNSANYIPTLGVHVHVGLLCFLSGQISLDKSKMGFSFWFLL